MTTESTGNAGGEISGRIDCTPFRCYAEFLFKVFNWETHFLERDLRLIYQVRSAFLDSRNCDRRSTWMYLIPLHSAEQLIVLKEIACRETNPVP